MSDLNKVELIDSIKKERINLEELLQKLTTKQMLKINKDKNWSVKDIIGHITYWDVQGTRWLKRIAEGTKPDIVWANENSIKGLKEKQAEINYKIQKENQKKPLNQILEEFDQSYQELIEIISLLTEQQLMKKFIFNYTIKTVSTIEIINWRKNHYKSHRKQLRDIILEL